ncbi:MULTISPECIES: bifunctional metallophosphatase/5'-nucleotidase [Aphanothece]|uniref:bifunctional metallophosphatase/5'-nucleotidase n=1 Tax=Aphanothece TaxID=1121 RepID=UPI003984F70E
MTGASLVGPESQANPDSSPDRRVVSILHTNDMHSNVVGVGPLRDYTPLQTGNDATRGGYARLGALIAERRRELEPRGPVLVLDAGDFSMGTAVAAACRELGAELQLMGAMGYDATTFGNHEFDLGPDGLGQAIAQAVAAGPVPAVVASNSDLGARDDRLLDLQRLAQAGVIRPSAVIERGGLRIGLIGLIGYDAFKYAADPGAVTFADPIETARSLARELKQRQRVDMVVALSHGGVIRGPEGRFDRGEDVALLEQAPEIDVVIGGHTHTRLEQPLLVGGRPAVQSGRYGEHLGELVLELEEGQVSVRSYRLIPVDDQVRGDAAIQARVEEFLRRSGEAAFASRGYATTQPLVRIEEDWPMNYADVAGGTPLANLFTDALRQATGSAIAFTANGIIRAGLIHGKSGIQTVYDVFALAPLGAGVVDDTAGSALVTAWFTAAELKNLLEFFLVDDPNHPGEYFPRVSGLRFTYDPGRPRFDQVVGLELGDLQRGYRPLDLASADLLSFSTSLYVGVIVAAIPRLSKGALSLQPKLADGSPLTNRTEAIADPRASSGPYVLPAGASLDRASTALDAAQREIKEWQAVMDFLRQRPDRGPDGLPLLRKDGHCFEQRAIRV